jgi:hypothetical protein
MAAYAVYRKRLHASAGHDSVCPITRTEGGCPSRKHKMNASPFSPDSGQASNARLLWFATLFAAITYAALSTRALLSPYEINHLIEAKRLLSVLLGAVILWFALRAADRLSAQKAAVQAIALLRISAVGVLALFAAREIYDLVESGELAASLGLNIRFMLTWIGYFAAAVAGFLAFSYHRQLQVRKSTASDAGEDYEVRTLLTEMRAQRGYESADIDFAPDAYARAQRRAQIDRLLDRLG